jgi:recombinational DNA repair ATPase RecF
MILRKINYHEFKGESNYWELKDLTLERINLLVGKNATGKTRTLRIIDTLSHLITDKGSTNPANYDIVFMDDSDIYS